MSGHVSGLSRPQANVNTLVLGDVIPLSDQTANVLVVCFEFSALMVACGGRHVELSTILQWRVWIQDGVH